MLARLSYMYMAYQGKFGIPVSWEEKERGVVIYMEFPR